MAIYARVEDGPPEAIASVGLACKTIENRISDPRIHHGPSAGLRRLLFFSLMELRDLFHQVVPRERAGPTSSDRFEYQRDWALCRLLDLHESGADYLIAFDLHEDVIVFDSEENPTGIWFYQVKTRQGKHWTVGDIIRLKKSSPLSPLAKLFTNYMAFPAYTRELTFVSNSVVKLLQSVSNGSSSRVAFSSVVSSEQKKMIEAVREQCQLAADPDLSSFVWFDVASLSLDDHVDHATGKLATFLERLSPTKTFRVTLVYRTLAAEISRRNNHSEPVASFTDVQTKKGIGRVTFDGLLKQMGAFEDYETNWQRIENRLNSEAVSFLEIESLKQAFFTLEAKRTETENISLFNTLRDLSAIVQRVKATTASTTLAGTLNEILSLARAGVRSPIPLTDCEIKALALICLYETRQLSPIDSSAQEKEA